MRTVAIWTFGLLASMIVGAFIGTKLAGPYDDAYGVWGFLAGGFAFACLRLWLATPRPPGQAKQEHLPEQAKLQQAYDLGGQVSKEVIAIIDDYVATQLVPAVKQLGDVLKKEWEQAPQSTEAEVLASWSSVVDTVTEFSRRMLRELYDKLGESNYTLLLIEPKDERSLNLTETYIDIVFKRVIGEMAAGLKKESDRALARARGPRGDI